MKALKWSVLGFLGLLTLAVVGLLIAGSGPEAKKLHHEIIVARPSETVFLWVVGAEQKKRWMSWLVDVRPVSGKMASVGEKTVMVMDDPNTKQKIEFQA